MRRSIAGKVVVVIGASSGIGRETALRLAARGAHIVVAARRRDRLTSLTDAITHLGGKALAVPTDVTAPDQIERLLGATIEHFGRADIWINSAGVGMVAWVTDTTDDEMRHIWEVNFMGAFHGCRAALQQMMRQGSGHIINVSSLAGRFALPLNSAYAASKHAVNALSQSLGRELQGSGIRVSVIMPGLTDTEFFDAMVSKLPGRGRSVVRAMPVSRVADAIVRCAIRPRDQVIVAPMGRWLIVLAEAFPPIFNSVARRYLNVRAGAERPWVDAEARPDTGRET